MARAKKIKRSLGRLALVAGAKQTLSNLFWRLLISMDGIAKMVVWVGS
jgi:hypothetical protein